MAPDGKSPDAAYPLAAVSAMVAGWIGRLGIVWVQGQLIQVTQRGSMVYATIRDEHDEISMDLKCSKVAYDTAGQPPDGTVVTARVKPDFYTKNGRLSLHAAELRPAGAGTLLLRIEQLKRKLQAEGLFAPARKQRLPFLPRGIGLITGANTAAERDVVENVAQRWPGARLEVRHTLVQGPRAAAEVMAALQDLDRLDDVDVIIVARGGGSLEDLLPFSDEGLVRAAAACRTPVVSAVGHETDNPLLDYVADVRVSTPTGAAEIVVPDLRDEVAAITQWRGRARTAVGQRIAHEQRLLAGLRSRPVLQNPAAAIEPHREHLDQVRRRLERAVETGLQRQQLELTGVVGQIRALSPQGTLKRGYSILFDDDGTTITSVGQVSDGQELAAYVSDGELYLVAQAAETDEERES